jgi:catechol 2,3-dioxygenase-like lactoylglutathione lyase family enzyme
MTMLKRVDNAHYWTKDMDASVRFYRDVLGLNLTAQYGEDWAEFDSGGTTVALHGTREGHAPPTDGATVVFEVDDLEGTMNALRGRDVGFEGEVNEVPGYGRFVSFRDPDGNLLQIFERAAPGGGHHHG